jgi:hypothetical protein
MSRPRSPSPTLTQTRHPGVILTLCSLSLYPQVILTLCINGTTTGMLLRYFDFDKKTAASVALAKCAQGNIVEYEDTLKFNMQHGSQEYAFANWANVNSSMLEFEDDKHLFGSQKEDVQVDEVVEEQFLAAFLSALDTFRMDAKVPSPSPLPDRTMWTS